MGISDKERILIAGLPKSGTTILTYRISAAFNNAHIYFEPGKQNSLVDDSIHLDIYSHPRKIAISKSLYVPNIGHNLSEIEDYYTKKIWIYRDPRDWLISKYLYRWKNMDDSEVMSCVEKLKEKESNPADIKFLSLANKRFAERVADAYEKLTATIQSLSDDWFVLKYENFVDHKLAALNAYLGVEIDPDVEVDQKHERVVRSKSYGNWKDWFNDKDVETLQPLLNKILEDLDYVPLDWDLNYPDTIDSSLGSEYIFKLYNTKKKIK